MELAVLARRASVDRDAFEVIVEETFARVLAANESSLSTVRDSTAPLSSAGNDPSLNALVPQHDLGTMAARASASPARAWLVGRFQQPRILLHLTHRRSTRLTDVTSVNLPLRLHHWHT